MTCNSYTSLLWAAGVCLITLGACSRDRSDAGENILRPAPADQAQPPAAIEDSLPARADIAKAALPPAEADAPPSAATASGRSEPAKPAPSPPRQPAASLPAKTSASSAKASAPKPAKPPPPPAPAPSAPDPQPTAAEPLPPVEVKPAPVAAPKSRVEVPSTAHVRVEVPAGLQHWLDEDDRMRPWLGKAIAAADGCYVELRSSEPAAAGTIEVSVTMHENARPTASVASMPAALKSLTMCLTRRLWSVKMPLFTGNEGERYLVRARFEP